MRKKFLSCMMVAAMTMSLLAGCGGGSDSSSGGGGSTSSEKKSDSSSESTLQADVAGEDENTLSVAAWDPSFNIPALKAAGEAFKKVHPEFNLNILEQSQSSDVENAITLAGSSGDYSNLPDIVLFQDHYIQKYVADYPDAFQSLDGADINWDDFGAEKLSYSTINGTHYGAPVDNGTVVFAYRTDILEESGFKLEDVTGISWEKWLSIAKTVKEKTGKYLLSMDGDGNDLPYMMLQAEGVSQFKDGKPQLANDQTIKDIIDVIVQGAKDETIYLANDWSDYTDQTIVGDMVAGVMNGNWIIPTIEKVTENSGKWEITSMPTLKGGEGYASNGGSSLYITGNCSKPDLAKEFLAYTFGGGEGSTDTYDNALTDGGVITTCISAGKSDVYQKGVEYFNNQPIYADIVEMGSHVPVVEQSDFHYPCRTLVAAAIHNIIEGANVDDELKNAQEQLEFQMEE